MQEFDHVRSLRDVSPPEDKIALVAALYDRRILDPSSIIPRFQYELTVRTASPLPDTVEASVAVFYDSLKLSLTRYLRGRGHPDLNAIHAIVHPTDFQNHRDSLCLRSILLMLSIHGYETRPVIPASWQLKVHIIFSLPLCTMTYSLSEVRNRSPGISYSAGAYSSPGELIYLCNAN